MSDSVWLVFMLFMLLLVSCDASVEEVENGERSQEIEREEERLRMFMQLNVEEAKKAVSPEQYEVLFEKSTEPKWSSPLNNEKRAGTYVTAGCNTPVFRSEEKYDSGSGWPSFFDTSFPDNIELREDNTWFTKRTEVVSKCGEHLGHVFNDGPEPSGLRYCINGLALEFVPDEESA